MIKPLPKRVLIFFTILLVVTIPSCVTTPLPVNYYSAVLNSRYPNDDFLRIDREVWNLKKDSFQSIEQLARKLGEIATSDWEKVRAIYIWITKNIAYDVDGLANPSVLLTQAEDVVLHGKSTCSGYANVFQELATRLGLRTSIISGYAKGLGFVGLDDKESNHAWNSVFIDGRWRLFDSTWGAGYVTSKRGGLHFVQNYNEHYFDARPDAMIFRHLPMDESFQLIQEPIDRDTFFRLPNTNIRVFEAGLDPIVIIGLVRTGTNVSLPNFWNNTIEYQMIEIPYSSRLVAGEQYRFVFESRSNELMVINNQTPHFIQRKEGQFVFEESLNAGTLSFYFKHGNRYQGILQYEVD
jgi:hypothetical protein